MYDVSGFIDGYEIFVYMVGSCVYIIICISSL